MLARKQTETPRPASLIGLRILLSPGVIKRFLAFRRGVLGSMARRGGLACTRLGTRKLLFINELQHDSRSPRFSAPRPSLLPSAFREIYRFFTLRRRRLLR